MTDAEGSLSLGSRMEMKKSLSPSQEEYRDRLYRMCLNRFNRKKPSQSLVKVEVLPYGFAGGSVDTYIEKHTSGWGRVYGQIGIGAKRKKR